MARSSSSTFLPAWVSSFPECSSWCLVVPWLFLRANTDGKTSGNARERFESNPLGEGCALGGWQTTPAAKGQLVGLHWTPSMDKTLVATTHGREPPKAQLSGTRWCCISCRWGCVCCCGCRVGRGRRCVGCGGSDCWRCCPHGGDGCSIRGRWRGIGSGWCCIGSGWGCIGSSWGCIGSGWGCIGCCCCTICWGCNTTQGGIELTAGDHLKLTNKACSRLSRHSC